MYYETLKQMNERDCTYQLYGRLDERETQRERQTESERDTERQTVRQRERETEKGRGWEREKLAHQATRRIFALMRATHPQKKKKGKPPRDQKKEQQQEQQEHERGK